MDQGIKMKVRSLFKDIKTLMVSMSELSKLMDENPGLEDEIENDPEFSEIMKEIDEIAP